MIKARTSRLRILVLGYVIRGPLGGMVWSNLQYLMGLRQLGHDVYFLEDSDDYPSCYDPTRHVTDTDPSYGLGFAQRTFDRIGMGARWAYYDAHSARWIGPAAERVFEICRSADVLLNLCGVNPLRPWLLETPIRILVDEDPAFTQIRHLSDPGALARARQHNAFFTFGENIHNEDCTIPNDGLPWRVTRQPLVLNFTTASPGRPCAHFTTVMQWDSYPAREYRGMSYGNKSQSFIPVIELPATTGPIFTIAIGGASAPLELLREKGWGPIDPLVPTKDPWTYQAFIEASKAEFSVAKQAYVTTRSGWFSERSVAYLATGRPVVVQETGFTDWLGATTGVLAFENAEQAVAAIADVNARYDEHCRAAREVAAEYFDSQSILQTLIDAAASSETTRTYPAESDN